MNNTSTKYMTKFQTLLKFPNLIKSKSVYKIMQSNYEDLRKVMEDGESYCAVSVFVPSEILSALNVHFLPLEPVTATAFQLWVAREVDDIHQEMLGSDTCCCSGPLILALYERGLIPLPKYIIACSHMCDDSLKAFNFVSKHYDIPIFNIDVPYYHDDKAISYVASQLRDMVEFICQLEGASFDIDALREVIAVSNRTNDYRHTLFNMTKKNPPVFKLFENLPLYPLFTKFGRKALEEIYAGLVDEAQNRIEEGRWASGDGNYRMLWLGMIPLAYPHLFTLLDSLKFEFSMTELMYHSDFDEMDATEPFIALSRKLMNYPLVGNSEKRIDRIGKVIKDFGIEGVIHFNHRGCIAFNGDNFIASEYLREKGIPFLVLEGDIANKDAGSMEKMQEALLNFRNVLEEQYGRR